MIRTHSQAGYLLSMPDCMTEDLDWCHCHYPDRSTVDMPMRAPNCCRYKDQRVRMADVRCVRPVCMIRVSRSANRGC